MTWVSDRLKEGSSIVSIPTLASMWIGVLYNVTHDIPVPLETWQVVGPATIGLVLAFCLPDGLAASVVDQFRQQQAVTPATPVTGDSPHASA